MGNAMARRELTPKQERFCLSIVEGDGQADAYRDAYDTSRMSDAAISVEAARLMRNTGVRARIAELRQTLQRSLGVSRATLLREIDAVMDMARAQQNVKTLLGCVMAKAKLLGFLDALGRPTSLSERHVFGDIEWSDGE
jgi:hypothetical protein